MEIECKVCREELKEMGGLLFSPPDENNMSKKTHLCLDCYKKIIKEVEPMQRIRGLSGFGDSIYLRAIMDACFPDKTKTLIYTNHPDLFLGYDTAPFNRNCKVDYNFSYLNGKHKEETNQWQDMLINGNLSPDTPYNLNIKCSKLESPKPILLKLNSYDAFGNGKGVNGYMVPSQEDIEKIVVSYTKEKEYNVIGLSAADRFPFLTLCNFFYSAEKIICQQGWGTALAEGLNKPCDVIFTYRAKNCQDKFINSITPEKVFTKKTSKAIYVS